jgi:hypothetical protein
MPSGRDGRGLKLKRTKGNYAMTDTNNSQSKRPTHTAYQVRDAKNGGKGFWTRIGSAWAHADGNGFNVQLEVVPLDGRITLRVATEKKD